MRPSLSPKAPGAAPAYAATAGADGKLLRLEAIAKSYGPVQALSDVHLSLRPGEVRALVGENGAGKSTLVKIIAGVIQPDRGSVTVDGDQTRLDPRSAIRRGIATIFQERALVPQRSVVENLFLGREKVRARLFTDERSEERIGREVLQSVGLDDPHRIVADLSSHQQQLVVIAKALAQEARLLILDEPTAALDSREVDQLMGLIERLKLQGLGILYITHRLAEVARIAESVTVLRDGEVQLTCGIEEAPEDILVKHMIGRELKTLFPAPNQAGDRIRVAASGLTAADEAFADVSFEIRAGEIVGIAGLEASGKSELAGAVAGAHQVAAGSIEVDGQPLRCGSVSRALQRGVAYVPPDRRTDAIFPNFSVRETITIAALRRFGGSGLLDLGAERKQAVGVLTRLRIRGRLDDPIWTLSGGNQQKAVIARAVCSNADILILDEPTAGVDLGTKAEIYKLLTELVEAGASVLTVSSEMLELIGLCHRIIVLREGRVAQELTREEANEESIMAAQMPRGGPTKDQRRGVSK